MGKSKYIIAIVLVFFMLAVNSYGKDKAEITAKEAIKIANGAAEKKKYNAKKADMEVVKVKQGIERGPIRLAWLVRYFPPEERTKILKNEFWIVYFYPKGTLEEPTVLGGEFCVLADLYSGKIIAAFEVP